MFVRKTAEDLEKLYAALSDEEKAKFDDAHESTISKDEKAEEDVAENVADEQTAEDRVDESVTEQEEADGEENSQDAEDRVDEAAGEEVAAEEQREEDHEEEEVEAREALDARIKALEEQYADLSARFAKVLESIDNVDFGRKPDAPTDGASEDTESPVMRAYYAKTVRR